VDGWQMQCCGDPFSVGSAVEWSIAGELDVAFLASFLPRHEADRFTDAEEHHDGGVGSLRGVVTGIDAVFCSYATERAGSTMVPVEGSGLLVSCQTADGWEPAEADRQFVGYGVDLQVPE
jgi:hypothetical protein